MKRWNYRRWLSVLLAAGVAAGASVRPEAEIVETETAEAEWTVSEEDRETEMESTAPEEEPEAEIADAGAADLNAPLIEADDSLPGGTGTVWDCVYFGSYPVSEVTAGGFDAADWYAVSEDEIIGDAKLFGQLEQAEWQDRETVLDGCRYRRMKASDAVSWSADKPQHYRWEDEESWHYFRYEPIKWRVIGADEEAVTLMADRQLDCAPYHVLAEDVFWEDSTLRSFLNGYGLSENSAGVDYSAQPQDSFYGTAFSDEEKQDILKTELENTDNYYFGTDCGENTGDYVYILHELDVFCTDEAAGHGFDKSDGVPDEARRFAPTLYALARGAWYSSVEGNEGNGFWLLRTCGYTPSNVNYVDDFGAVYNRGTYVTTGDAGLLPVIRVDRDSTLLRSADTVFSGDVLHEADDIRRPDLKEPEVKEDGTLSSGLRTTWDCVYFGCYPACEITAGEFDAVDVYAVDEGSVLTDSALMERLEEADWQENETVLDGVKYRRMQAGDAVSAAADREQHYRWHDEESWHYFRYEPIKWRVLELNGDEALLVADREMDCAPFNLESADVTWETSTLRSFLNGYDGTQNAAGVSFADRPQDSFLGTAFSAREQAAILAAPVENPDNSYYGTECGEETADRVFILSNEEVFAGENAGRHGFYPGSGVDDPARRFRPTMYAMARGTWYSPVEGYRGNGFWFMRTSGYTLSSVTYICDFGYIYSRGTDVSCNDSGILPAIRVDLNKAQLEEAGTVSSGH